MTRAAEVSGWKRVPIGELVKQVESYDPARTDPDGAFEYIDLSAVDQATKSVVGARRLACAEAPSRARQRVCSGDVLVSTVRPNLNGVARIPEELNGATASTGFCVLRPNASELDGGFLFQWVKSPTFIDHMVSRATGQSYPAVSDRIVCESLIPLPPLPEQRRIADILDRAEAVRAKRRAALALLDSLPQAIFLDMFGEPAANPKQWQPSNVGDQLSFQQYGPRFYNEAYTQDGPRIVRITDLDADGRLDFAPMPRLAVPPDDLEKYRLRAGDIIFARTGATVGKVALIEPDAPECIAGAYFITMRFKPAVHPRYARAVLTAPSVQDIVRVRSRQAAQQNFSGPGLRALPMPVPPAALQQDFARRVAAVEQLRSTHRLALAKLDELFAALQHRAFRGEL